MIEYDRSTWDQWMQGAASPALIPARWEAHLEFASCFSKLAERIGQLLSEGWEIARADPYVNEHEGRESHWYCIIARRPPKFEERNG